MEIRPLEKKDKEVWKILWLDYVQSNGAAIEDRIVELTWSRLMTEGDPHESKGLALIDDDGNIAGIAHYLFHRHGWLENDACYIQDIYVAPEYRRKGYGQALMQSIADIAEENQSKLLYWMAQISNENARKLYDKFGEMSPFVRYWKISE